MNKIHASTQSIKAIQWLNFFLADVKDGLGPYLGIFLLTIDHWDAAKIGVVMTAMGIATLIAQTPAGAFIDFTRKKKLVIAITSIIVAITALGVIWSTEFLSVVFFKTLMGLCVAFIGPAIAGMTLGLVGPDYFAKQVGKNEAYNHAGNITAALLAGLIGYFMSVSAVFYLPGISALCVLIALSFLKPKEINHQLARGFANNKPIEKQEKEAEQPDHAVGFFTLFKSKVLLLFTACICLFHFANAAMLPLLGQRLATENQSVSTLYMSASIIVAQAVMIPAAIFVSKKADSWGRKKLFLLGFLVLPIRGVLYTLGDNSIYLVSIQILDGIGAGIFGALFLIVIADLTEGTGRFNITMGAVSTIMGVGAALSPAFAGIIVVKSSYNTAFLVLAAIAAVAFVLFFALMPETKNWMTKRQQLQKQKLKQK